MNIISIVKYGVAVGLSGLVPLLLMPILTKSLTVAEFGLLSGFLVYANLLATFAIFSTNGYVSVKYHKLDANQFSNDFYLIHIIFLISCCLFSVVFYVLVMLEVISIGEDYIYFVPVVTLLLGLHLIYQALFQTSEAVDQFVSAKLIVSLVDITICLIILSFIYSLAAVSRPISWGAGLLISVIFSYKYASRFITYNISMERAKSIAKFCLPLLPHVIVGTLNGFIDKLVVLEKIGAHEMGYYMAAVYVATSFLILIEPVNKVFAPWIFKSLKSGNHILVKRYIKIYCLGLSVFGVFFILVGLLIFDKLVPLEYSEAKAILPYLICGCLFQGFYYCRVNILFYFEKNHLISFMSITVLVINLVLTILLTTMFGVTGAAISFLAVNFLMYLSSHYASHRELSLV